MHGYSRNCPGLGPWERELEGPKDEEVAGRD
jgi:hypothetical protein